MPHDLQELIDKTFGETATVPDHPQEPTTLAVERERQFDADRRKLAALRAMRMRQQRH